jgi:glucokinase
VEAGKRAGLFQTVVSGSGRNFLAIEIGGTKLQLFVGDAAGQISQRWRFDVDAMRGGAGIRAQIESALPEILRTHEIVAVGVGYGGPVDVRTGKICCSHQVEGWSDFQLGDWLRERTDRPVVIDNDANCGALGEALRGAGQGGNPVFYVTLGSGVGGGLAVDGKIFHGAKPGESEIGHVRLDKGGRIIEHSCSGWAVDKMVRGVVAEHPTSALAEAVMKLERGEARALVPALAANCPFAQRILSIVADDLAFGLSHVVHLVHPEAIVLGGGFSFVGEPLRAAVAAALGQYVMEAFAPGPRVALALLREDAVPVGALLLAASATTGQ